ncbi:MAG TPA: maleylpyruvate isomerase N-terminal domain-containing protein [Acidimicrobiales bacterium]|jgi:uncharacterized protein (TIGR03083 family)
MTSSPPALGDALTDAFFSACHLALEVVGSDAVAEGWASESALEGFSVGGLAAHLYSAIRLFESALEKPEATYPRVENLTSFYGLNRVANRAQLQDEFNQTIRTHAAHLAEQGSAVLADKFEALVTRLGPALAGLPMTRLVPVWRIEGAATHLSDYLRTRVVELAVHADDLAISVDTDIAMPEIVASVTFAVFLDLARARSGDVAVMRTFARRERGDPEVLRVF